MAVIYLFSPQKSLVAVYEAAALVHDETAFEVTCEFKTDLQITSGFAVGFKCVDGRFRLFEIDEVDYRDAEGDLYVTATDQAVRELTDIVVEDLRCVAMTAPAAVEHLLTATSSGWVVGSVLTTAAISSRHYYKTLWECLVNLMDRYGIRMEPYYVLSANGTITEKRIDLLSTEATYRGRFFESGDETGSVTVTVSGSPKTALYGRGKGVESGETEEGDATYGPRLNFGDVVWSTLNGDPVDKPLHQEWVGDPDALQAFGRNGKHRFGVAIFEDETDPEKLLQRTWDYLQTVCWPTVSATATIYDMEMAEGYTWAAVRVNDLVVIRPKLFPADITAKIVKIHRDYVDPAATKLEISSTGVEITAASLYSKTTKQLEIASQLPPDVLTINSVIDTMRTQIMSSGTRMYTDPNTGAFVFVSADGNRAMMLTGAGWMIASSKTGDGSWNWRTAATGSGIVADQITAGVLQASIVKIFGSDHFYWDSENIYIREGVGESMTLYNVTLTKTSGVVTEDIFGPQDVDSATTTLSLWAGGQGPGPNTDVYVTCDGTDGSFIFSYASPDGSSTLHHTFTQAETFTFNTGAGCTYALLQNLHANITGFRVYMLAAIDPTDVGTTWDLGSLTIPASETAYSGALKLANTVGTYRLSVGSVSRNCNVQVTSVDLSTATEVLVATITGAGDYVLTRGAPFDLMLKRPAPSLKQIRIGKYDGTNYGIGYTTDGGATWQTAMDFNGLNVDGDAIALRTEGGYIDIRDGTFSAGAASTVNIQSGGSFTCQAGSDVRFITDDFAIKNSAGKNLMAIGSTEGREGQIILGDEGFPVNFAGDFILPVENGGTGYNSGQVHRVTSAPPSGLGKDGDLAIRYASSSGAYSAFVPVAVDAASKSGSRATRSGMDRYWNVHNWVDSAIPENYYAAGNDNGYAYGIFATFTSPQDPVSGVITLELTGYKYYQNASGLTCYIADENGNILASGAVVLPYRSETVATVTFSSLTMTASTNYQLLICDSSSTLGNTSKSYIRKGSLVFPAYSGSQACGLYIKSAGSWVTVFTT